MRRGFTLPEMMIVLMIIGIMAALAMSALSGAAEQAREKRTRAIIAKLDILIGEQYEGYKMRPVPIRIQPDLVPNPDDPSLPPVFGPPPSPRFTQMVRLYALRDLQRMELPDRKSDIVDGPADCDPRSPNALNTHNLRLSSPSLRNSYIRRAMRATGSPDSTLANWSEVSQGAECLYLIVSNMRDGDRNAIDFFSASEIGDTDGDGMPEILDAWGQPIEFLRWAPGYLPPDAVTLQTNDADTAPDRFDPLRADPRWQGVGQKPFDLVPLIFSGGTDKSLDVFTDNTTGFHRYSPPGFNNAPNPYGQFTSGFYAGQPMDSDGDGTQRHGDNITNHHSP